MKIAILVLLLETFDSNGPYFNKLLKTLENNSEHARKFYLSVQTQTIYESIRRVVGLQSNTRVILRDPAESNSWSSLFKAAYEDGNDYFLQIQEDSEIIADGQWENRLIKQLQERDNTGIVGIFDREDYHSHLSHGIQVTSHAFLSHRLHYEILAGIINSVDTDDNSWVSIVYKNFSKSYTIAFDVMYTQKSIVPCKCVFLSNAAGIKIKEAISRVQNFILESN